MALTAEIWGLIDFNPQSDRNWVEESARVFGLNIASSRTDPNVLLSSTLCPGGQFISAVSHHHLSVVAHARLHNRPDLSRLLDLDGKTLLSDSELILASYEKWGEGCARHLLGEFSFAIWDSKWRRLFCCRDHIGFRPFVYYLKGNRLVFSNDILNVLRTPGVPRTLNRRKFAGLKVFEGHALYHEDTFHAGIQSLAPGTIATASATGFRKSQYWQPGSDYPHIPKQRPEIFEALRELLVEAVECRISDDEPFAAELSGGLDSSAVVAIAAASLKERGKMLTALSVVLPDESLKLYKDERQYANEFLSWPNIRIEYVTGAGLGPFDGTETLSQFARTPVRASTHYIQTALTRAAQANGIGLRLRGLQGEMGPTAFGDRFLVELAVSLRWRKLWLSLKGIQRVQHIRPIKYLAHQFLKMSGYPSGTCVPHVLLTKEFLRNGIAERPFFSASPNERRCQLAAIRRNLRGHSPYRGRSPEEGNWYSYPWLDKRVIEFCLAVPSELKIQNGYRRNLMREALDGLLPKKIQWRVSKTPISPDYNVRYNAQLALARDFVAAITPKDPIRSIIDIERLAALMHPVDTLSRNPIAMHVVPANIYAICFLRQFAELASR